MNAMYCRFRKKKLFPSRQEMLFALLPDVPRDTENAAYLINGSCIYGAFLADDGSWDYTLTDDNLCFIDSGQLGEDGNTSYKEAMELVLSYNFSSVYEIYPIPWHVYEVWLNMAEHVN